MIDLGLFVAESYNQSYRHLDDKLAFVERLGIEGGLVHLNASIATEGLIPASFMPAIDSRLLGQPDLDISKVRHVTYRQSIIQKPSAISPLMAKCADMKATLYIASPFSDAQSSSIELASRGGYRQVNYNLAKALLQFICEESRLYGCRLHVHGVSSSTELNILKPYRESDFISASVPAYLIASEDDVFGYSYEGRLSPGLLGVGERAELIDALRSGYADALTSHHHLFADELELDPITAEVGANLERRLGEIQSNAQHLLGKEVWEALTISQPKSLLKGAL